ncbi:hypothetical protein SAMN04487775_102331 [Treponema bryantii]|uniref:Uncharacterized protein n=1 Tax=Treponema bryantii TaxID=163 RepID=A0A1I3J4B3_9SPIR|nr:hypothetical protein [Treponema bryantii]SFI55134.1 hypothetical protein SAMN04487775_102331 [Treponema bryantii]
MIRQIEKKELPICLDFIHLCFSTVAEKFGKEWYFKNEFEFKGTVKYEHLPFTVGFAECYVGE